jgi:hypothetical protein
MGTRPLMTTSSPAEPGVLAEDGLALRGSLWEIAGASAPGDPGPLCEAGGAQLGAAGPVDELWWL